MASTDSRLAQRERLRRSLAAREQLGALAGVVAHEQALLVEAVDELLERRDREPAAGRTRFR